MDREHRKNIEKIALIGFGDLGQYIKDMLTETYSIKEGDIIYFDDNLYQQEIKSAQPFSDYLNDAYRDYHFYICLGYRHLKLKKEILNNLIETGRSVPYFIHHSAYVHPTVKLGSGTFIYPGSSIDRNTVIGNGVWIANTDTIAHDCSIGDCCWFGASVTLSGKVNVLAETFIGSGTVISNALHIGNNVIIGLGSVITKDVLDNQSVIGNPMRLLDKKLNLM